MNLSLQNLPELGQLKITIVEKHADGTCRVHTYASADGIPQVTTTSVKACEEQCNETDLLALCS
ncbi:MAG TPA: hypothetical protein VEI97_12940 [bacterium]|nr:hypothetical protein [bacterium]